MLILMTLFLLSKTKLYVPVDTLLAKGNQKLLKLLSKRFEKRETKGTANEYSYFLE